MIFETEKTTLEQWLADNPHEETIEFLGDIDVKDIENCDSVFLNSAIKNIDISCCNVTYKAGYVNDIEVYIKQYCEDYLAPIPVLTKIFYNSNYSKTFKKIGNDIYSEDESVLIHTNDTEQISVKGGIRIIGNCAFSAYEAKQINLPKSVKEIGNYAFANCENLENLNLPNSIEKLGESTFLYIEVYELVIPDKVEVLPYQCCKHLGNTILPKSLKSIEDDNAIKSDNRIILPEGLEYVGSYAFNFNRLSSIHFPSTVKHIEDDFYYDDPCGTFDHSEDYPRISIDPKNKYFYIKDSKLQRKFVEDAETQRHYTDYALRFLPEASEKDKYKDKILTTIEIIKLVNRMPEGDQAHRESFYYHLLQTSILTDEERELVEYLGKKERAVWKQMHFVDESKTFVMYGISANGDEDFIKEFNVSNPFQLKKDYETLSGKYTKIICRQYSKQDTEYKNPLGQFEVTDDGMAINNVSFILKKCPEKFRKLLE